MSKYNKEELEHLILDEGLSYEEIGKRFEVTGNAVKKAALKLGIELPQRRITSTKETFNKGISLLNRVCDKQFIEIISTSTGWDEIISKVGYKMNGSTIRENILKRCEQLQIIPNILKVSELSTRTKGDLFSNRKNWQSARSSIQKDARKMYFDNNISPKCAKCAICGYTNHVEVAHIKAVSEFSNDTPIFTINSITNLIGLCPNHHWEYDNGILDIT